MSKLEEPQAPGTSVEHPDPRWELAQRVAASKPFLRSARMRRFLLYICERALTGKTDDIIEQQIGTAVFDRKPDYSPSDDNIVRVEARNLRKRLQEYFDGDGRHEPLVIAVPKGGYAPVFEPRVEMSPVLDAPSPSPHETHRTSRAYWIVTALVTLAAVILGVREVQRAGSRPTPIWLSMLDPGQPTLVVLADSNFALYQDLKRQDLRLDDYIGGKYVGRESDATLATIARRQYTSLADAILAARIVGSDHQGHASMRFARLLQVRDLHSGNAILIGSKRANPWVELFEPRLNFTVAYDSLTRQAYLTNKAPQPGESSRYVMESGDGKTGTSYGLISLVPNLSNSGRVLMLQGLNMEATEAIGQFIMSPAQHERLRRAVAAPDSQTLPPFEMLIRLRAIGGAASDTEIIAVRPASS